jgi:hypothetical protein
MAHIFVCVPFDLVLGFFLERDFLLVLMSNVTFSHCFCAMQQNSAFQPFTLELLLVDRLMSGFFGIVLPCTEWQISSCEAGADDVPRLLRHVFSGRSVSRKSQHLR